MISNNENSPFREENRRDEKMGTNTYTIDDKKLLDEIAKGCKSLAEEVCEKASLKSGQIIIVGCSTSMVLGKYMGTYSVPEVGEVIYKSLNEVFAAKGVYIAAQCCEHLNRAIVVEEGALKDPEIVNVVPAPKAGGSFATACYKNLKNPIVVEEIKADAGIDIGGTLIGMHLKKVAVPLHLENNRIGEAVITGARVRPKFIGGIRAGYDENLL